MKEPFKAFMNAMAHFREWTNIACIQGIKITFTFSDPEDLIRFQVNVPPQFARMIGRDVISNAYGIEIATEMKHDRAFIGHLVTHRSGDVTFIRPGSYVPRGRGYKVEPCYLGPEPTP